jgi:predicted GIY-YIG superfamily endonuclease
MQKITSSLSEMSLSDFRSYPSVQKVAINHGYIYILKDSSYPGYIKVGMTRDLKRRYKEYNQHKPYNTAEFVAVSDPFEDAVKVEKKILEVLVKEIQPIGAKLEWFEDLHEERMREIIIEAESHFLAYNPAGDIYATN